jgi:hypothetical protein
VLLSCTISAINYGYFRFKETLFIPCTTNLNIFVIVYLGPFNLCFTKSLLNLPPPLPTPRINLPVPLFTVPVLNARPECDFWAAAKIYGAEQNKD